ncbi:hypothetical protein M9H77_23130 [Catharanthus roseus]|uniref:Uncharacterized protein n=1 Tax=Catharanthus roseus TaxID=4058 RepID=A0ACC0AS23_CATRO|nr:hypothetical protein M9H77_23130 [Catharanthus roseus]
MVESPFAQAEKLPPIFGNVLTNHSTSVFVSNRRGASVVDIPQKNKILLVRLLENSSYRQPTVGTNFFRREEVDGHVIVDVLSIIMQELQIMRKDMKEMRGNITKLSMEHRDQRNIGCHVTSHTQWGYGIFSPHTRTFEHNSYDCYEGNRLGARNGYNDISCKRFPRNEVKNI